MELNCFAALDDGALVTMSILDVPANIDFDLSLSKDAEIDILNLEKCSTLSEVEMGKFMVG
jgi:hypothetical protein